MPPFSFFNLWTTVLLPASLPPLLWGNFYYHPTPETPLLDSSFLLDTNSLLNLARNKAGRTHFFSWLMLSEPYNITEYILPLCSSQNMNFENGTLNAYLHFQRHITLSCSLHNFIYSLETKRKQVRGLHQKRCPFLQRGLECKSRKSRNTWNNKNVWLCNTKWSMAKANRVLPRECIRHSKHPLPTTQETTLHRDITR